MDVNEYIKKYENELLNSVIPFWVKHCPDMINGGYHTYLDKDGSVYDTEKAVLMHWRIVYMFAVLSDTEYKKEEWLDIAIRGFDYLTKYGKNENGIYYFALNNKGEASRPPFNIYAECFAAMGSAALFKVTGESKYKSEAEHAIKNYIDRVGEPEWDNGLPGEKRWRFFGHYMMLANLGFELNKLFGNDEYNGQIEKGIDTIFSDFWNEEYKVMFENIIDNKGFDLKSSMGRHLLPGHGLEAMWLILQYAEKENRPDYIEKAVEIIKAQVSFSWDKTYGGIYYFMDVLGKPQDHPDADMKLWWVHNEAAISTLYGYCLTKDDELLKLFLKIDEWSFKNFQDSKHGEWFGYLNRRGEVVNDLKGGEWKTFFHLPRYLLTVISLLKRLL